MCGEKKKSVNSGNFKSTNNEFSSFPTAGEFTWINLSQIPNGNKEPGLNPGLFFISGNVWAGSSHPWNSFSNYFFIKKKIVKIQFIYGLA